MKKLSLITMGAILMALTPAFAFAQTLPKTTVLFKTLGTLVSTALVILGSAALLVFFWGIVKYISAAGDPKKASEGKGIMIWGAVALFVMFSIFGIIRWLRGEFAVDSIPTIPTPRL